MDNKEYQIRTQKNLIEWLEIRIEREKQILKEIQDSE